MRDKDLYSQILGIQPPWKVAHVELEVEAGEVKVFIEQAPGTRQQCPRCGADCSGYDHRQRSWRHLDTCQLKTILVADVPRVNCSEHGVVTVHVPWSEPDSGFTALFEALVIDWLKEASIAAVSRRLGLSWNAIDRIMQRAVRRGLRRRSALWPIHIGVDETSFRKRHDYVTVVSDKSRVLYVADDRSQDSLAGFYESLSEDQRVAIKSVSMDMWPAYIKATRNVIPDADEKIAFDKFHVAKYLGEAVVVRTKHRWLMNPGNMSLGQWRDFKALRESTLKTARAWANKEFAMSIWHYTSRTWAIKAWKRWLSWAVRCRLDPMKKVARTIKAHLRGIINAVVLKVDNGGAESINSRIKMIKVRSRGFRSKSRFRHRFLFSSFIKYIYCFC
jgi:transposase